MPCLGKSEKEKEGGGAWHEHPSCHWGKIAFRLNAGNGLTRRDQECDPRAARWLCERRRVPRNQTCSCQGRGVLFRFPTLCTRIPFSHALPLPPPRLLPPPPASSPPPFTRGGAQTASLPGKHTSHVAARKTHITRRCQENTHHTSLCQEEKKKGGSEG